MIKFIKAIDVYADLMEQKAKRENYLGILKSDYSSGKAAAYSDIRWYIDLIKRDKVEVGDMTFSGTLKSYEIKREKRAKKDAAEKDERRIHIGFCGICGTGLKKFDFDADEKGEVFRVEGKCPKCGAIVNAKRGGNGDEKTDKTSA